MAKKIRKLRKGRVDKGLFGCRFVTTKTKHTNKNKGCLQSGNFPASLSQSTNIGFKRKNPNTQIWAILEIIVSTLAPIVSSCVLNYQCFV